MRRGPGQWFSPGGDFDPNGPLARSADSFGHHNWEGGGCWALLASSGQKPAPNDSKPSGPKCLQCRLYAERRLPQKENNELTTLRQSRRHRLVEQRALAVQIKIRTGPWSTIHLAGEVLSKTVFSSGYQCIKGIQINWCD